MLFLPSAPTISLTVPTSAGLPSLRVIQCSSRKLGTFISQSLESHGFMSRVEAEAEAEWPASVALLEAFSGLGFSSMRGFVLLSCGRWREREDALAPRGAVRPQSAAEFFLFFLIGRAEARATDATRGRLARARLASGPLHQLQWMDRCGGGPVDRLRRASGPVAKGQWIRSVPYFQLRTSIFLTASFHSTERESFFFSADTVRFLPWAFGTENFTMEAARSMSRPSSRVRLLPTHRISSGRART